MSATLTVPPLLEPVTLTEVKAHLKIDTGDEDTLINRFITAARQHVEQRIDEILINQTWKVFFNKWPVDGEMEIPVSPVNEIIALRTYSDDDLAAVIDPAHYYADLVSTPQKLFLRAARPWASPGRVANGIEIELVAGHGAAPENVPEPLRQAVLVLVAHWYENRSPDCNELPTTNFTAVLDHLLAPYKKVRL